MSVYLCCGNAFMAHHFLYCTQVRTALHEMCCEGMAQRMGVYVLMDAGQRGEVFKDQENHHTREPSAPAVEE